MNGKLRRANNRLDNKIRKESSNACKRAMSQGFKIYEVKVIHSEFPSSTYHATWGEAVEKAAGLRRSGWRAEGFVHNPDGETFYE